MRTILVQLSVLLTLGAFACGFACAREDSPTKTTLLIVLGAPGDDSYAKIFSEELASWRTVAKTSDVQLHVIGDSSEGEKPTDKDRLHELLARETKPGAEPKSPQSPFWIVFIGHGTFDSRTAAFNLRGPDVTSAELAEWLQSCERPLAVINTTAASAPFLTALSRAGRVVITATKSGQERNYARFGRYFARRVIDPDADLDKDDQTSLFEAFAAAARDTTEFYKSEGRVATEHPLLDDNGDGRGVRDDFFDRGKPVKAPTGTGAIDGDLARRFTLNPSRAERQLSPEQIVQRDELETALEQLRRRKSELSEDEYFAELERLLIRLAKVYNP